MSRSVGIKRDLRLDKVDTYGSYYFLNFRCFTGQHGDCYDRYLIRMFEMVESLNIINQVIFNLNKYKQSLIGKNIHNLVRYTQNSFNKSFKNSYNSMENLINHFKMWGEGFKIKPNFIYKSVESPKGEFGVSLVADNTNVPYRCKVRSPAYHNMHILPQMSKGHFLADLVAIIGTLDVVFGEVDR